MQRFGVEKCLVIGFSEMAFLHWKQVLRVQFQHRIWLSWFFLRFFCLQKGQRIRFIFSSGFAARATSISTTICQKKKNREEDLNKGEYRYLKCTRPCWFFFHTVIISICLPLFQLKPIYLTKTWKWDGYKFDHSLSIGLNIFFHSLVELKNELNFTYTSNLINVW